MGGHSVLQAVEIALPFTCFAFLGYLFTAIVSGNHVHTLQYKHFHCFTFLPQHLSGAICNGSVVSPGFCLWGPAGNELTDRLPAAH